MNAIQKKRNPWAWVPTLYFAEGLPYVAVMTVAVIMYKKLGLSNTQIALYTSWLYLPWVIKPLWSPFIDLIKTKRWWVNAMQTLIAAAFASVAFFIPTEHWVQVTLAFFWLLAFASATHDIAADGFYMHGLQEKEQSMFVGIRNIFYRVAMIFGQGLLVMFAGWIEQGKLFPSAGDNRITLAWSLAFYLLAGINYLEEFWYYLRHLLQEAPSGIDDVLPADLPPRREPAGEDCTAVYAGYPGSGRTGPLHYCSGWHLWHIRGDCPAAGRCVERHSNIPLRL